MFCENGLQEDTTLTSIDQIAWEFIDRKTCGDGNVTVRIIFCGQLTIFAIEMQLRQRVIFT